MKLSLKTMPLNEIYETISFNDLDLKQNSFKIHSIEKYNTS
jgi:hypothetical protein